MYGPMYGWEWGPHWLGVALMLLLIVGGILGIAVLIKVLPNDRARWHGTRLSTTYAVGTLTVSSASRSSRRSVASLRPASCGSLLRDSVERFHPSPFTLHPSSF